MDDACLGGPETQQADLYREIVDNARMATGAYAVYLYWFDREKGRAVRVAGSTSTPRISLGVRDLERIFQGFSLEDLNPEVTANPLLRQIFLEGMPVRATLEEVTAGFVDVEVLAALKSRIGIAHVFAVPLRCRGQIFAALTFHHAEPITQAIEAIGKAFARQVTLLMENTCLLAESRRHLEELRRSHALLAEAEEELRRKVAEFLHGEVQSRLLVVWHRLGEASDLISTVPERAAALVEECRDVLDRVREEDVRKVSHRLHPAIIQVGLIPALRSLADTNRHRMDIRLSVDAQVAEWDSVAQNSIPQRIRLTAYRIVQEALANACRHARASSAEVRLSAREGALTIVVVDDGDGLPPGPVRIGLGLGSIDARLSQLGGSWRLENNPDGPGALLTASVPVAGIPQAEHRR